MSKKAKTTEKSNVISLKQQIKKRAAKIEKHEKKIKALKKAVKKVA